MMSTALIVLVIAVIFAEVGSHWCDTGATKRQLKRDRNRFYG